MAVGWNLTHGELTRYHVPLENYWAHFNFVFSDACSKRSTYKYGLIKSIIDCLYSAELTSRGMELSYSQLFSKFTEIYWNLIAKYEVKQLRPDGRSATSRLEQLILSVRDRESALTVLEFEDLNPSDRDRLVSDVQKECHKNVIGALFMDFKCNLYGFDHKEQRVWLHPCAYQFLMTYKLEIEQMNYLSWAKFLEKLNADHPIPNIIGKIESSTLQRKNLSIYRNLLYSEYEANNCFYCGSKIKETAHVDHVIPWSFIKSDHLWNFVLACPKCNSKKSDLLPPKPKLAEVVTRNQLIQRRENSFIQKEFIGYTDELLWNIWDYAHNQGYAVMGE